MSNRNENAPVHPNELRKLQAVLLDILTEVDRICRKHDISYTMVGGTLLGAVRHKGFIPWDDDVDIAMMRTEYERFKAVYPKELDSDKYFFQDHTTDPHYRWGYARLRRKDSEFVRVGQEHMKMQTGIFLDIFPGDYVPEFYPLRLLHALKCYTLRKILYAETGAVTGANAAIRMNYRFLNKIPAAFAFKKLRRLSEFWNARPTNLVRALTFPTAKGGKFAYPASWYTDMIDMEFEGKHFMAIRAYDDYLKFKYGDYMRLPPENKRHWHPAAVLTLPEEYRNSD